MSVQNIELVRGEENTIHWLIPAPNMVEIRLQLITAEAIVIMTQERFTEEGGGTGVYAIFTIGEIEDIDGQLGSPTTYQLKDTQYDEILFTGSVTLTGEGGGTPEVVVFEDLVLMKTDADIADVAITAAIDRVITTTDNKEYRKNALGTAWELSNNYFNTFDVHSAMTAAQIQAVIDAATAGQVVKFAPGTYALGASALIFKDGVHMDCGIEESVTFTSSNATGTLHDNNVEAVLTLSGFPVITNTGGLAKRIVLQNVSSAVGGFYWEYKALVTQTSTNAPTQRVLKNTLGGDVVYSYDTVGVYIGTLVAAFTNHKTAILSNIGAVEGLANFAFAECSGSLPDAFQLHCLVLSYDAGLLMTALDDELTDTLVHIIVYP